MLFEHLVRVQIRQVYYWCGLPGEKEWAEGEQEAEEEKEGGCQGDLEHFEICNLQFVICKLQFDDCDDGHDSDKDRF